MTLPSTQRWDQKHLLFLFERNLVRNTASWFNSENIYGVLIIYRGVSGYARLSQRGYERIVSNKGPWSGCPDRPVLSAMTHATGESGS